MNDVSGIRNTVKTIKYVMNFFEKVLWEENIFQIFLFYVKHIGQLKTKVLEYLKKILNPYWKHYRSCLKMTVSERKT